MTLFFKGTKYVIITLSTNMERFSIPSCFFAYRYRQLRDAKRHKKGRPKVHGCKRTRFVGQKVVYYTFFLIGGSPHTQNLLINNLV